MNNAAVRGIPAAVDADRCYGSLALLRPYSASVFAQRATFDRIPALQANARETSTIMSPQFAIYAEHSCNVLVDIARASFIIERALARACESRS